MLNLKTEFTFVSVCSGIGGGTLGFAEALTEYMGYVAKFRPLYGIDVDPEICKDYENLTGDPCYNLDLFDRQQYIDWHGHEPPEGWEEVTPDLIRRLSDGVAPDVVFFSAPCKGFSGLLPKESAKSKKYQALNKLYWRVMWLYMEAFPEDGPALIISENVPRIKARGADWLKKCRELCESRGYAFHNSDHDCGEIGGLAQIRHRNMSVARNQQKCSVWLHQPPKKKHKTIGEVIGPLPLPGDTDACGPLHKLPRLQWKVWMRLAMIPAGGDWRDLEKYDHTKYGVLGYKPRGGALAVEDWDSTSRAVTGGAGFGRSNGAAAINDMRFGTNANRHVSHYRVEPMDGVAGTVTGATHVANGRICVSDTRLKDRESRHPGVYQIVKFEEVGPCVTGTRFGSGAPAIADPRVKAGTHSRQDDYGVYNWHDTAKTVRGAGRTMNSRSSIADPRINCKLRAGTYGVVDWNGTAPTIAGSIDIHQGTAAFADPRVGNDSDAYEPAEEFQIPEDKKNGVWIILSPHDGAWHRPLTTYELAMLQGFPSHMPDGKPFQLVGGNDAKWRERIGNAVPPAAARAIAESMLLTLMASQTGDWFGLSMEPVWVAPEENEVKEPALVH
ncbi:DNA cytosine methyltransferase [Tumebacillus flagellatus]|uniref:DNA (cytosine-5-)-methyltransferase n=1 Tax=Tumebacillus flagellatus TaxID=1157490 RepID=A0A074LLV0_9BACL|nr:DNA cytosine methyltransferase [Tumebacillus flagellatus]KEO80868.1 hypothetical protein EL26_23915 [Tumebacillus flagellatus]